MTIGHSLTRRPPCEWTSEVIYYMLTNTSAPLEVSVCVIFTWAGKGNYTGSGGKSFLGDKPVSTCVVNNTERCEFRQVRAALLRQY